MSWNDTKILLFPPTVILKPFKTTGLSILARFGDPNRERLTEYSKNYLISSFIVEVCNQLLPVCAIPISDLVSKCVHISLTSHSYIMHIPNNFEHH